MRDITRQVGVRRKKDSNPGEGRCNTIQIYLCETFILGPRQVGFAETATHLAQFRCRPSLEEEHDGIGGADCESYSEIWMHTSDLDSAEHGRSAVGPSLRSIYMDLETQ